MGERLDVDTATIASRFNVNIVGHGACTLLLVHGFGCNQSMWAPLASALEGDYRLVLMDLAGCGLADPAAYDPVRHGQLSGYVDDVMAVADSVRDGPLVLVGHSVGASIALEASLRPQAGLDALVLIAASPCFVNDGAYQGGFPAEQIESVLEAMHENRLHWAESFAVQVVGRPHRDSFAMEFVRSFCAMHEDAVETFARVTFLQDQRSLLPQVTIPTLVLQALNDPLAPVEVGHYLQAHLPAAQVQFIDDTGHSLHLTSPQRCARAMRQFLARLV